MFYVTADSYGSMLELSWNGTKYVKLENSLGALVRTFLEDGDAITMTGLARGDGFSIGFGECYGRIYPARQKSNQ